MMEGVKDRIKATFASLIPDEAWDKMVKDTVNAYFHRTESQAHYDRYKYSQFQMLVFSLMEEETKKRIADFLKSEEYSNTWNDNGKPELSKQVEKMFIENSGAIFLNLLGGSFQAMMNDLEIRLRNPNRSY